MKQAAKTVWRKNPLLAWREIDGAAVIISPGESVMHELNGTGSVVWRLLDGRSTAAQIAAQLASEYEVSTEAALGDTDSLLEELAALKLILPAEAAAGAMGASATR